GDGAEKVLNRVGRFRGQGIRRCRFVQPPAGLLKEFGRGICSGEPPGLSGRRFRDPQWILKENVHAREPETRVPPFRTDGQIRPRRADGRQSMVKGRRLTILSANAGDDHEKRNRRKPISFFHQQLYYYNDSWIKSVFGCPLCC